MHLTFLFFKLFLLELKSTRLIGCVKMSCLKKLVGCPKQKGSKCY